MPSPRLTLVHRVKNNDRRAAWEAFLRDEQLQRTYRITADEMQALKQAALFGSVLNKEDFILMLNVIRRGG